jgi:hypothetical protein
MLTARKINVEGLSITSLNIDGDFLIASISDGRIVSLPIAWFPKLLKSKLSDLKNFEISPSGYGIHWPALDEDISITAFINP